MNNLLKNTLSKKPYPIALSAGFFGFFAHLGFIEALKHEGIEVNMISGSSAGALAGAIIGSGLKTEDALKILTSIPIKDIWDPGLGFGYLKWAKFEKMLADTLHPKLETLDIKIAVSVFELKSFKTKIFREGPTAPIIRASCTPPFLVHPAKIFGKRYFDGGIFDKPGVQGIDSNTPFISHFLMSHLADRKWEFSKTLKNLRPNQLMISFPDLIEIKPKNISDGYKAFYKCYENTLAILNTDLESLKDSKSFFGDLTKFN
ncbi:MAG: patatin-like phospholipase family protein [Bdellovibrionales bacterium]|nr:patatin-like phospholipase family protein [Bdellovibrionales bacterium]